MIQSETKDTPSEIKNNLHGDSSRADEAQKQNTTNQKNKKNKESKEMRIV